MRIPRKKVSARATALALGVGVVGYYDGAPGVGGDDHVVLADLRHRGTAVTITGVGFNSSGAATAVRFNGTDQPVFTVVSDTSITTTVPGGRNEWSDRVDAPNGNTVSTRELHRGSGRRANDHLVHSYERGGWFKRRHHRDELRLHQLGDVQCGCRPTTYVVNSATPITATVPAGATTGPLHVTTPVARPATSATNFTVAAGPTITSFSPTSGNIGTSVTITGTNLLA